MDWFEDGVQLQGGNVIQHSEWPPPSQVIFSFNFSFQQINNWWLLYIIMFVFYIIFTRWNVINRIFMVFCNEIDFSCFKIRRLLMGIVGWPYHVVVLLPAAAERTLCKYHYLLYNCWFCLPGYQFILVPATTTTTI